MYQNKINKNPVLSPCHPVSHKHTFSHPLCLFLLHFSFLSSCASKSPHIYSLNSLNYYFLWLPPTACFLSPLALFLSQSEFCSSGASQPRWLLESCPSVAYRKKEAAAHLPASGIHSAELFVKQQITWLQLPAGTAVDSVLRIRNMIQPHFWSRYYILRLNSRENIHNLKYSHMNKCPEFNSESNQIKRLFSQNSGATIKLYIENLHPL